LPKERDKVETTPFDPAESLDNDEAIVSYMTEALETGDPCFVADALGVIARAGAVSKVARQARASPPERRARLVFNQMLLGASVGKIPRLRAARCARDKQFRVSL